MNLTLLLKKYDNKPNTTPSTTTAPIAGAPVAGFDLLGALTNVLTPGLPGISDLDFSSTNETQLFSGPLITLSGFFLASESVCLVRSLCFGGKGHRALNKSPQKATMSRKEAAT